MKWALGMMAVCFIACMCANAMAEENAPVVTIVFDKDSVNIGETITAQYEITGNGNYEEVNLSWFCRVSDGSGQSSGNDSVTDLKGKTSFAPKFGKAVFLHVLVTDSNGQWFDFSSEEIPVVGDSTVPPTITVSFDKDSVNIGETITAQYEITGNGSYEEVNLSWFCRVSDGSGQSSRNDFITDLKGKTSFAPKFGKAVFLHVLVTNSNGQWFDFSSEEIPIRGTTGAQTSYTFIEGGNTPAFTGNSALTFRVNADFEKFRGVLVDDQPVDQSNYTAWSGSTFVQMKESYLQTLSDGRHMLSVLFSDGYAETPFMISQVPAAPLPPKTGDANHPALWMTLLGISMLGILELRRCALKHR